MAFFRMKLHPKTVASLNATGKSAAIIGISNYFIFFIFGEKEVAV